MKQFRKMRLTSKTIEKINTKHIRREIASALGLGEDAIKKAIKSNQFNGTLTKASAVAAIIKAIGIKAGQVLQNK